MHNANALKLGLFGANCSSGRAATKVPERWSASWEDCLALARMADEAGIDFMLPIGRWKGYGGSTDMHGETLETITWATGLLGHTERITVFGTIHAPLFHPVIAAKQCVTADHVGCGRFGLNIVAGWNEGEFEMFGVEQREHDARYDYAQDWIDAIKRCWGPEEDFDFDGAQIKLKKVRAKPKPFGGTRPVIMNAGSSGPGQAFAMRNCDAYFTATQASRQGGVEATKKMIADIKAEAAALGREIEVFTVGQIVCRRPRRRPRTTTATPASSRPTGVRSTACCASRTSRPRRWVRRNTTRSASISRCAPSAAIRSSARPIMSQTSLRRSAAATCAASRFQ